mmetsp:Transcript_6123/g.11299  ORF Transcript_6123/g.11299 Transcript_6123/m.11299 type:complete len:262 (+) Transcript_6123:49-834(+)
MGLSGKGEETGSSVKLQAAAEEPLRLASEPCLSELDADVLSHSGDSTVEPTSGHPSPESSAPASPRIPERSLRSTGHAVERDSNGSSNQMHCHVKCSRKKKLELATELVHREGWSKVSWKDDFSALHLAAKLCSKGDVRQLVKDIRDSADLCVLGQPDLYGFTPIDYAVESMLGGPSSEGGRPTIDLEVMDLLCPDFAREALDSGDKVPEDQADGTSVEESESIHIRGGCEDVLRVAANLVCSRGWPSDFSFLQLAAHEDS